MGLHKRSECQLVQILLGNGCNARLTTQLFVMCQMDVVVLGIKNDKLILSINLHDGNKIWDESILGLLHKALTSWCCSGPLRFINQINKFLMPQITLLRGQRYRKPQTTDWLL